MCCMAALVAILRLAIPAVGALVQVVLAQVALAQVAQGLVKRVRRGVNRVAPIVRLGLAPVHRVVSHHPVNWLFELKRQPGARSH
jgi:hypothetical protein